MSNKLIAIIIGLFGLAIDGYLISAIANLDIFPQNSTGDTLVKIIIAFLIIGGTVKVYFWLIRLFSSDD